MQKLFFVAVLLSIPVWNNVSVYTTGVWGWAKHICGVSVQLWIIITIQERVAMPSHGQTDDDAC